MYDVVLMKSKKCKEYYVNCEKAQKFYLSLSPKYFCMENSICKNMRIFFNFTIKKAKSVFVKVKETFSEN